MQSVYDDLLDVASTIAGRVDAESRAFGLKKVETNALYSVRMGYTKKRDHASAAVVALEIMKREVRVAGDRLERRTHLKVLLAFVSVLVSAANKLGAYAGSARMAATLLDGCVGLPQWATRYTKRSTTRVNPRDVQRIAGLNASEWGTLVSRVHAYTNVVMSQAGEHIANVESAAVDLDVARNLSRIAASEVEAVTGELPVYDRSEANLSVRSVTVAGFRGAVGQISLSVTKNGKPTDVLLWGDNGVGKSTFVDGLEFALQGRIDRSADFNSSLRARVPNLTVEKASATVELSDESTVYRDLAKTIDGRVAASREAVRPGFRIAPVAIRRADIIRFLDTEAISRGTIFFDYFPDPTGDIGARPDEELNMLREEQFRLRVARDELAHEVRALYPRDGKDYTNRGHVDALVKELLAGVDLSAYEQPMDALPTQARGNVSALWQIQTRLSELKKKLDAGVQNLNPKAYRDQQARIVPVLHAISDDLTGGFLRIARAEHVKAIKVLLGKSGPVSLDVVVEFTNGAVALPQQVLSEGYRDLIALLFFLAVTRKAGEMGQAKILVLDDALQSVDASVRLDVMDFVLEEFKEWQLIVTGHDRAWLNQLRRLYQTHGRPFNEHMITRWTFNGGIELGDAGGDIAHDVREELAQGRPRATASASGMLLEQICQELSWRLEISIHRKEGDRYTLGDLWPGVEKVLRKTSLQDAVKAVHLRLVIRNLLGAHFNEWAEAIPWSDVEQLAQAALVIYDGTHCVTCATWARLSEPCKCGALSLA
ncbi:hypothetical protein ACQEVI_26285 [Promicromonospora sp. CA-289599]|uniref:hypothetical protein n=1 Tax=Promicromonospora sp. CA-289599 TaxID=3240014 RepID=UPI003D917E65